MSLKRILFISGWGTGEEVWNTIKEIMPEDLCCDFIPWFECLDTSIENNKILNLLSDLSEPVILVGWSLGGMIALNAAAMFTKKVSGLVLVSTSSRMIEDIDYSGVNKRVIKAMRLKLKNDKLGLCNDFAKMGVSPSKNESLISEFVTNAMSLKIDKLSAGLSFLLNSDFRKFLKSIKMPVNILHGKFDQIMKLDNALYLNQNLVNSNLNIINREGHFLPQRKPELIIDSIKDIITKI